MISLPKLTLRPLVDWVKQWIVNTAAGELQDDMCAAGADPGEAPSVLLLEGPKSPKKRK